MLIDCWTTYLHQSGSRLTSPHVKIIVRHLTQIKNKTKRFDIL